MDYKEEIKNKLDELKEIEGFPNTNSMENLLDLATPPSYTPFPNPFISDFIKQYGKPYDEENDKYKGEPYVGDVSEGKNDPIYTAHSYHTKVPHKAIIKYIEHFTEEGDVIFDGFSGSGMTGVAASQIGRKTILNDLSPLASFLSHNFNTKIDAVEFVRESESILKKAIAELGWVYKTKHTNGELIGDINYTIWSDVMTCGYCGTEYVYWNEAAVKNDYSIPNEYQCPSCQASISKDTSNHVEVTFYDESIGKEVTQIKKVPVLINYKVGSKRFDKIPDEHDIDVLSKIEDTNIPYWFPTNLFMDKEDRWGDLWVPAHHKGITNTHHFYTKRNLYLLAYLRSLTKSNYLLFQFTSIALLSSKLQRWRPGGKSGILTGTLYIASLIREENVLKLWKNKIKALSKIKSSKYNFNDVIVSTQSTTDIPNIPSNSIDYIFTDPPFGRNIMYSEASFIWDSWLKVTENNKAEAIINKSQFKKLPEYHSLVLKSFSEYHRVLKPKRWITVEFHNAKSSVWNSIQEAISKSGFVIAQVTVLDKKSGSYKQVTAPGAVANDLVISAYKPSEAFATKFLEDAGENMEVMFVQEFLEKLPSRPLIERTEKMLYSKMLAYYIQRAYQVKQDSKTFYALLNSNFIEEDGFWFTSDQINSYIEYKKYAKLNEIEEIKTGGLFLFVTDEKSALVWLHNFLNQPKSFSDVSVAFNQLANIQDDQVPELRDLLEENFVFEGGLYRRPKSEEEHNQITEKRQKHLWREFETILIQAQTERKKIKEVRKEALTYGFERCYKDKRFKDILTIASKLHPSILENNGELADFVEAAEIQVDGLA